MAKRCDVITQERLRLSGRVRRQQRNLAPQLIGNQAVPALERTDTLNVSAVSPRHLKRSFSRRHRPLYYIPKSARHHLYYVRLFQTEGEVLDESSRCFACFTGTDFLLFKTESRGARSQRGGFAEGHAGERRLSCRAVCFGTGCDEPGGYGFRRGRQCIRGRDAGLSFRPAPWKASSLPHPAP